MNSVKRAQQDNKSWITLLRKRKYIICEIWSICIYQACVPAKEYMNDRSLVPAMKEFADNFKHFLK